MLQKYYINKNGQYNKYFHLYLSLLSALQISATALKTTQEKLTGSRMVFMLGSWMQRGLCCGL